MKWWISIIWAVCPFRHSLSHHVPRHLTRGAQGSTGFAFLAWDPRRFDPWAILKVPDLGGVFKVEPFDFFCSLPTPLFFTQEPTHPAYEIYSRFLRFLFPTSLRALYTFRLCYLTVSFYLQSKFPTIDARSEPHNAIPSATCCINWWVHY